MKDLIVSILMLAGMVLALFVVFLQAKAWLSRDSTLGGPTWTLRELTELRDSGELTIDQFEKLKEQVIGEAKRG